MTCSTELELINAVYPRISSAIATTWGTQEGYTYLNSLLFDTRENTRNGFSKEVAAAIAKLQMAHNEEFPEYVKDDNDVWSSNYLK